MKHLLTASIVVGAITLLSIEPALSADAPASDWKPVPGKLMTRWAKNVSPTNAHPEYPRPQMVRKEWQNLNGLWEYAIKPKADAQPSTFDGKILVPFPVESALSGVAKTVGPDNKLWYRRSFTVPAAWREGGQRVLLHFGAVDWETTVWVNGQELKGGPHRGGFDPFSFDITDSLKPGDATQEVIVGVFDPSNANWQPRGKQVNKPGGIFYTATTGIWQTVWLEPVPKTYIRSITVVPDVDGSLLRVTADVVGASPSVKVGVGVSLDGKSTQAAAGDPGQTLEVKVADPKLWTPDTPVLYAVSVALHDDNKPGDRVLSYSAFRKVYIGKDEKGVTRLLLNNKFVFQYGPLDQGFWPDGLYTAPTDEALKYDLEITKRLGFNMIRKHVKVEPATWYAHCDSLGILVWQDMPSGDRPISARDADLKRRPESAENYEREWTAIINSLRHFPCIVMWVPFNEGWGQFDTARIVDFTRKLDPTRLVDSASGWTDRGVGDVHDIHVYPGPGSPKPEEKRAAVLGEFGGLGLPVRQHTWQDEKNWGYRSYESSEALTDAYVALLVRMHPLVGDPGLSAAVYTQTTDVETEVNGLMTYDREVMKMDEKRIAEAARKLYGPPPVVATLVPTAPEKEATWQYTIEKPAADWEKPEFDDAKWKSGPGGFGTRITPGTTVRTEWSTPDIWVRRTFELPEDFKAGNRTLYLMVHHDEDAELYLNGILAAKPTGYTTSYGLVPITGAARTALKPGKNVIAIHCHQTGGGQYIDAGVVEVK